jgi:D-glucuronyl C5-epimerase C-terminus
MPASSTHFRPGTAPRLSAIVAIALALSVVLVARQPPAAASVTVAQTAHAAAAVRSTLAALSESGRLTAGERYRYRRSLRLAMRVVRTLDLPSKARRRDELGAQIVMLATLASRRKLTPDRMRPLFRQLDANRVWFAAFAPPKPLARLGVPGDRLVYAYYPGHGLQLQPLFNWTQVNSYWFAKDYAGMQALIDELAALAVPQPGGWVSWEYAFDYPGSRAPWLSGMAQGVAIQALARGWEATQNERDLALARRALPGLGRRLAAGGLVVESARGRWWPLYSEQPSLRVLNGDLQAVISLYDYAAITGDAQALAWAQDGARAAAAVLPKYDTGAWSRYHGSEEADLGYHDLMTLQLRQLALKSGDPVFRTYADRFTIYRVTPPVIAATASTTTRAYPSVDDSPHAAVHLSARLSKISRVTLVVTDAAGSTVAASRLGTHRRGLLKLRWNAHVRRRPAVPGEYQLWLSATDLAGNRSERTPVGRAAVERDTAPPALRLLRVGRAGGKVRLRWESTDNASRRLRIKVKVAGHTATVRGLPLRGRQTLALPAPGRRFTAWITVTDESGNGASFRRLPS